VENSIDDEYITFEFFSWIQWRFKFAALAQKVSFYNLATTNRYGGYSIGHFFLDLNGQSAWLL